MGAGVPKPRFTVFDPAENGIRGLQILLTYPLRAQAEDGEGAHKLQGAEQRERHGCLSNFLSDL